MRSFAIGAVVGIMWLCALFSLSADRSHDRAPRVAPPAELVRPSDSRVQPPDLDRDRDEGEGAIDLFGNDVSDAVARYTLDAAGSLYEVHSPQTEIPKLGSPKS